MNTDLRRWRYGGGADLRGSVGRLPLVSWVPDLNVVVARQR